MTFYKILFSPRQNERPQATIHGEILDLCPQKLIPLVQPQFVLCWLRPGPSLDVSPLGMTELDYDVVSWKERKEELPHPLKEKFNLGICSSAELVSLEIRPLTIGWLIM